MTASQRILITGARGRLATLITNHYRTKGNQLTLFSRTVEDGFYSFTESMTPARLAGPGALLHLAWSTLPATSEAGGGLEWEHDLPVLDRMLQTLGSLPAGERPHFIFFSSGGTVYGNAPEQPNVETDPCCPISCYGRAKLEAEKMIRQRAEQYDLAYTILRVSNPYGYSVPKSRAQGIVPHAIRCAYENQILTLWGDGHARKDFLHYTDFLSAVDLVVAKGLTGNYNLSAGESHTIREVIDLVEKQTGRKIVVALQPAPIWDVTDSRLNSQRLITASGWSPKISLNEGILLSATNYISHS